MRKLIFYQYLLMPTQALPVYFMVIAPRVAMVFDSLESRPDKATLLVVFRFLMVISLSRVPVGNVIVAVPPV